MSSAKEKLEDLDITPDELKRLSEAFKKEEFKKLFAEYAEEISNPENRALYEQEIRQLEKERGMDVTFVHPDPGYVLKTTVNGTTKAFINICKSDHVGPPVSEKKTGDNGKPGLSWSIPHMFSQPREDVTKDKKKCQVYDFVVHPHTYRLSETNPRFRIMVNDLAVEGVQKMFSVTLDQKNCKQIKMKYKGGIVPSVIRNKIPDAKMLKKDGDDIMSTFPYPYGDESSTEKALRLTKESLINEESKSSGPSNKSVQSTTSSQDEYCIPKYEIKHQSDIDMQNYVLHSKGSSSLRPQRLIVEVFLPLLSSASSINLDVFEKSIKLVSEKPAKYKLEISLPYPVDENDSSAKFDKSKHKLTITLCVVPEDCSITEMKGEFVENEAKSWPSDDDHARDHDQSLISSKNGEDSGSSVEKQEELLPADEIKVVQTSAGEKHLTSAALKVNDERTFHSENNKEASTSDEQSCNLVPETEDLFALSEGIVVVHEKECPKLQSILKQRNSSGSSNDCESGECGSSCEEEQEDDDEGDDEGNLSRSLPSNLGLKKSVSFNDHVDRTVYLINQSVSTLHATLKNRKKKLKKREQRHEAQKMRQERRRSSGSFSLEEEGQVGKQEKCSKHSEQNKSKKATGAVTKSSPVDQANRDYASNSTCENGSDLSDDSAFVHDAEFHNSVGDGLKTEPTRKQNITTRNSAATLIQCGSLDSGIGELSERSPTSPQKSKIHLMSKDSEKPRDKETVPNSKSFDKPESHSEKPETILSWKDHNDKKNVKCPVPLENSEIFSLDLE